uniref:uncharacterized protein LOC120891592 n=1 Tax=Ictidomys tridecemlineatus TaxID=43179 RepID=UPI001A9E8159|nr:uncharacterized protein LOC120891592 [Ictidomys tridecemlineatus]
MVSYVKSLPGRLASVKAGKPPLQMHQQPLAKEEAQEEGRSLLHPSATAVKQTPTKPPCLRNQKHRFLTGLRGRLILAGLSQAAQPPAAHPSGVTHGQKEAQTPSPRKARPCCELSWGRLRTRPRFASGSRAAQGGRRHPVCISTGTNLIMETPRRECRIVQECLQGQILPAERMKISKLKGKDLFDGPERHRAGSWGVGEGGASFKRWPEKVWLSSWILKAA